MIMFKVNKYTNDIVWIKWYSHKGIRFEMFVCNGMHYIIILL